MADRKSLNIIGLMLGGVTATVMTIGVFVVSSHLDGRFTLDEVRPPIASVSLSKVVRDWLWPALTEPSSFPQSRH